MLSLGLHKSQVTYKASTYLSFQQHEFLLPLDGMLFIAGLFPQHYIHQYSFLLHITWEFYSIKLICRNLTLYFHMCKKAYPANQNGEIFPAKMAKAEEGSRFESVGCSLDEFVQHQENDNTERCLI